MTDTSDAGLATLGEIATLHSAPMGRELAELRARIRRPGLRDRFVGGIKHQAGETLELVKDRIQERPVPAILLALAIGLIGGRLISR
jgi:ElaB/YqjD/DUF883 family membrane-anchored ribosome-binding protein